MKHTTIQPTSVGTTTNLTKEQSNPGSSTARQNEKQGSGAATAVAHDDPTPTVGVHAHSDSLPTLVTHQPGMLPPFP